MIYSVLIITAAVIFIGIALLKALIRSVVRDVAHEVKDVQNEDNSDK